MSAPLPAAKTPRSALAAETNSPFGLRTWHYHVLLAVVAAAMIAPLLAFDYPGMIDYPSHLARCYIIAHFHAVPFWARYYRIEFGPIPNLAIEAITVPLMRLLHLAPLVAGKIFLTLIALLYFAGCFAIGGKSNWLAPLAALTFFNASLLWGFVNFMFGLSLAFLVFALWLRQRHRYGWGGFAGLCVLSLPVYLAHLGAIAILGLMCCAIAIPEWLEDHRFGKLILQLGWLGCPVALLFFGFFQRNGKLGRMAWPPLKQKAIHALSLVRTYHMRLDAGMAVLAAAGAIVLVWRSRWRRDLATVGVVLLAFYVIMPGKLFTASNIDGRFVAPACVMLALSLRPKWTRRRSVAFAALLLLMLARVGVIAWSWSRINARSRQALAMGSSLPPGARVDVLQTPRTPRDEFKRDIGLTRVVDLWAITRGSYESNIFAKAGQQPLIQRSDLATCYAHPGSGCLEHFDYVWTDWAPPPLAADLRARAQPVARWRGATLWRIGDER